MVKEQTGSRNIWGLMGMMGFPKCVEEGQRTRNSGLGLVYLVKDLGYSNPRVRVTQDYLKAYCNVSGAMEMMMRYMNRWCVTYSFVL